MFDVAIQFMIQFVNIMPVGLVLILVLNLVSDLLFGRQFYMNYFITSLLVCLISFLIQYFSVRLYIRFNKDLFWALYYNEIIEELKKGDYFNE